MGRDLWLRSLALAPTQAGVIDVDLPLFDFI